VVGSYAASGEINFGQRPFSYTPPTGFVALNTYNLPTPTISNGANYFAATTYTGNGSTQSINNGNNTTIATTFQPDFVWYKSRVSGVYNHGLFDSVRGTTKQLFSNTTGAEATFSGVTAFNSNGFSLGSDAGGNNNTDNYIAWQWKANGSGVTNTNGSITSTVNVNATAGFSVVTYTGNGTSGATIGHSLGVAPSMIIVKQRGTGGTDWTVYHASLGNTKAIFLDGTYAPDTSAVYWNNTSPTSSVFTSGSGGNQNTNGGTYVAYCWSQVAGFSKFGSYTGNGSTDGPFVYTGFRPRFVMIKDTTNAQPWIIVDTSRNTYNVGGDYLEPNSSGAEDSGSSVSTATAMDIVSNGFKLRNSASSSGYTNANGDVYVYAAFAENPFRNSLAR